LGQVGGAGPAVPGAPILPSPNKSEQQHMVGRPLFAQKKGLGGHQSPIPGLSLPSVSACSLAWVASKSGALGWKGPQLAWSDRSWYCWRNCGAEKPAVGTVPSEDLGLGSPTGGGPPRTDGLNPGAALSPLPGSVKHPTVLHPHAQCWG
jgi:hypothetical protein